MKTINNLYPARICQWHILPLTGWMTLGGVLAGIAYAYSELGFLVWFSFVPIFFGLRKLHSRKQSFWAGFWMGLVYFGFTLRWYLALYPLSDFAMDNRFLGLIIVLGLWLTTSIAMAFGWALFTTILNITRGQNFHIIFVAALFTLIEYLRSFVIGILWYGSETLLGPHWTLGNPTYSLSGNTLALQLSSYTGIYGITFAIILVNLMFYKILSSRKAPISHLTIFIATVVVSVTLVGRINFAKSEETDRRVSISLVQTKTENKLATGAGEKLASFKKSFELLNSSNRDYPNHEIVAFPEGTNFFKNFSQFLNSDKAKKYFHGFSEQPKLILDNSRIELQTGGSYSRAVYLNSKTGELGHYDKQLLTPGGEFFPYLIRGIARVLSPSSKKTFELLGEYVQGTEDRPIAFNGFVPEVAICSDMFSPSLFREKASKSNLLIVMASTFAFHGNMALVKQNLAINKFRAAENRIPVALVANYGLSYAIDSAGNVTKITPDQSAQLLTANSLLSFKKSWYNKVGDWPILSLSVLILLISAAKCLILKNEYKT